MTTRIDPVTGNLTGASGSMGGGVPSLTPEQRALCHLPDAHTFAEALEERVNAGKGKWFTARTGTLRSQSSGLIQQGEKLGLWRKDEHKEYWRFTSLTWPWIRTCIALNDERRAKMQERTSPSG